MNLYASAFDKTFQGQDITPEEEEHVMTYMSIFGTFAAMTPEEFEEATQDEPDCEYEEYIVTHLLELDRKIAILDKNPQIILLDELYEAGAIILTDANHLFPNSLIVIINEEGEQKMTSAGMGIEMDTKFLDNRMQITSKSSITGVTLSRHLCTNPDCQNCAKNREVPSLFIPYMLRIDDAAGGTSIIGGDFYKTIGMVTTINNWLNNRDADTKQPKYLSIIEEVE